MNRQNGVKSALTVDARQAGLLPTRMREQLLEWLRRVAPPMVAHNAFHVAVYEGCVEVTYYLVNAQGQRYLEPESRIAAQATWQEWGCELPPEEPMRMAAAIPPWAKPT